ncbi:MAG: hypothetical protein ABSD28_02980 [Tepidisphaeraceae bacterium]|jgi:hypothetical protein
MEALQTIESIRNSGIGGPDAGEGPRVDLQPLRDQAGQLLRTGLDAIDHILSGDSQRLLRASRQDGGQ